MRACGSNVSMNRPMYGGRDGQGMTNMNSNYRMHGGQGYGGFGGHNPGMRMNMPNQQMGNMRSGPSHYRVDRMSQGFGWMSHIPMSRGNMMNNAGPRFGVARNRKYRTKLCENYEKYGKCKKGGNKCQYAHGRKQLREEEKEKCSIEKIRKELEEEKEKTRDLEEKIKKEEDTKGSLWKMYEMSQSQVASERWKFDQEKKKNELLMKNYMKVSYNENEKKDDNEDNDNENESEPPLLLQKRSKFGRLIKHKIKYGEKDEDYNPQKKKKREQKEQKKDAVANS